MAVHSLRRGCARLRACGVVLLRLLEDLDHAPALGRGQRPGLHQKDPVADTTGVLLVVRLQLAGTAHDLAVQRVLDAVLDRHHDGLVHLVADHQALTDLAAVAVFGAVHVGYLVAHSAPSVIPSSRSRWIVYIRAMSALTAFIRPWFSSWPVACWKRRLNSSSLASRSLPASASSFSSRNSCVFVPIAIRPRLPR